MRHETWVQESRNIRQGVRSGRWLRTVGRSWWRTSRFTRGIRQLSQAIKQAPVPSLGVLVACATMAQALTRRMLGEPWSLSGKLWSGSLVVIGALAAAGVLEAAMRESAVGRLFVRVGHFMRGHIRSSHR